MKEIKSIKKEMNKGSTGCFIDEAGYIFYLLNGKYHRVDGPAIITPTYKYKYWYFHGKEAKFVEEFYDYIWRRKVEIEVFL